MYLLFDLGGTKLRWAISTDGETFGEPAIVDSPADAAQTAALFGGLRDRGEIKAVAGGLTLKKIVLAEEIKKVFACPVYLENDTALVGLGEATAGAGQGSKIVAYLTISTGVGGVRIIDGRLDRHAASFEPGHQIIDFHEPAKPFEDYVSGRAVEQLTGRHPRETTDEAFWGEIAKIAAVGIHNTILHWAPEVVVMGGSMMKIPGIPLAALERHLRDSLAFWPHFPELRLATLGDFGGLHGALAYLKQQSK